MRRRKWIALFSLMSLVLAVVVAGLWVWSYARLGQRTFAIDEAGVERTVRCANGGVIVATLSWRDLWRPESDRSLFRANILDWPIDPDPKGLPRQMGFFHDRRTFARGTLFHGIGLSEASVVRVPMYALLLFLSATPATWCVFTLRQRRARQNRRPLGDLMANRWKWVAAHVAGSYVLVVATCIGNWIIMPAVWWVTAPVSCVLILIVDAGWLVVGSTQQRLAAFFGIVAYFVGSVGALKVLGARVPKWWRRTSRPGYCIACGYDLRATPERCPECGLGRGEVAP